VTLDMHVFAYGSNPGQSGLMRSELGSPVPLQDEVGALSYNNTLDVLRAWAVARRLSKLVGVPAAASIKNGLPVGAALGASGSRSDPTFVTLAHAARCARPGAAIHDCLALACEIDVRSVEALGSINLDAVAAAGISWGGITATSVGATRTRFATVDAEDFDRLQVAARPSHRHYGLLFEEDCKAEANDEVLKRLGRATGAGLGPVALAVVTVENTLHRALAASAGSKVIACIGAAQTEREAVSAICDRLRRLRRQVIGGPVVVASGVNLSDRATEQLATAGAAVIVQPDEDRPLAGGASGRRPRIYPIGQRLICRW
jgi:AICAR transformylase/IMP cyclohydrolase PurH